jgi:hypothetical protein
MTRNHGIRNLALAAGLAVGSSVLLAGSHAYAQKTKPKPKPAAAAATKDADDKQKLADAKKHYGDGDAKFKAGDYAGALVEFQAADGIKPTPQAARYIGLCQDNLGHFQDAVTAYERFLANVPPKMAAQGDEIRARVVAIRQLPGKVHVDSDPKGASVALDSRPQANATPTDVEVPTGHHTLHLTAAGHDAVDKDVDVTFASHQDVQVTLPLSPVAPAPPVAVVAPPPPEPAPAPAPAPPPEKRSMAPAWITGGLAVVAAGVGTAFGIMALNDKSSFNKTPTESLADDGENKALVSDMAFGVAVTLGVTSTVLFLSHDDSPPAQTASAPRPVRAASDTVSVTATPIITAHGGGAGALIRF